MLMPSIFGENLFDEFFDDFARPVKSVARVSSPATAVMRTDVKENETGYELDIDLPGYKKEDVQAQLKDGYLNISASHNENKDEKDKSGKVVRQERYTGSMQRSFYVGDMITPEQINAKFDNGILTITIPHNEVKQIENKQIMIE